RRLGLTSLPPYIRRMASLCSQINANSVGRPFASIHGVPPQAIIRSILISGRLGPNVEHTGCFGLLLKHLKSEELHWLHPELTVEEVEQRYESHHVEAEWR
uniref:Focal adhesion kinase N-terminal domain-containing protein n=1 Tax=Hippocampus comes TaxID=109280 RepID=A0A3Q2YCD7_HIPCM